MKDTACVDFLQWALPRLQMRWRGFRKVRKQVCKRVGRRLKALALPDVAAYRAYLEDHPEEWAVLNAMCRISISRFYRDRAVFDRLRQEVLPSLAQAVLAQNQRTVRGWSIGCASGEEPYTLRLIWQLELQASFPDVTFEVVAIDADQHMLTRARAACYPASSLKDLPATWRRAAFTSTGEEYCLRPEFRAGVDFRCQDIRTEQPAESFHLILCRYLIFTYFDQPLQQQTLAKITDHLCPGGGLVIGKTEQLPHDMPRLVPWLPNLQIYRYLGTYLT